MSLRTIFLDELNALAKKGDAGLASKMREVMVDRHPATLDPDERDPVATVALAWKEVAPRGRPAFAACAEKVLADMDQARLQADPEACDWPFVHAILRLLRVLPDDMIDATSKARCVRRLAGLIAERHEMPALVKHRADPTALWMDAFRLYLAWHQRQPSWLETLWLTALTDENWPLNEPAIVFLEDAASRYPTFVSMDRLVAFWRAALRRSATIEDLRRWFYVIGATLEDTAPGQEILSGLFSHFGGHLQVYRRAEPRLPWDHFVESMAAMFRNAAKKQSILSLKSSPKTPPSTRDHYQSTSSRFKSGEDTVSPDLIASIKAA